MVRLAKDKSNGCYYAIKTYEKFKLCDAQRRKNVKREIALLKSVNHPNIIKLASTIETTTQVLAKTWCFA